MWGLGRTIAILVLAIVAGAGAWGYAIRWHPAVDRYPVQGVDVSDANGSVDWNMVAGDGADFAYAVATRGADGRDSLFEANWREIEAAGLRRGAIHVYSLCRPGIDQADAFNTVVPRDAHDLPAAVLLDNRSGCETPPDRATLIDALRGFLIVVEAHTGKPMLLKLSRTIERDYRLAEAFPRGAWVIGNGFAPGYAPRGWRMWQASDVRRIQGIDGAVNWDVAAP